MAFLEVWKWLGPYLLDFFHTNAPYQTYPSGQTGIFRLDPPPAGPLRIAVVADWGTGTLEATKVAENMMTSAPQLTFHLGDVYYMGEAPEINENCLGQPTGNYKGVTWPIGSLGSLALMGNHEMYSGGQGYFKGFLPRLGLRNANGAIKTAQAASYFCVETPGWIVLGLDTGYHSGGFYGFGFIPGIRSIPALNVDARFDDKMLQWLQQTMSSLQSEGSEAKPVLVLTHHQPLSAFEPFYKEPAEQLARLGFLNGREFVWLYGHEHRLTGYALQTLPGGLRAYPRCIGHGGMLVEITKLTKPNPGIAYYDPRTHKIDRKNPQTLVGYNGHVELILDGAQLTIEYHDILHNNLLLTETFTPTGSGALQYTSSQPAHSPLVPGTHS